ncbi:hypothetical protein X943_001226 [Babesia divergens]|uniref:Uncharacterized protein n=1 Tax=Babesia divergens TaxID=32595 RepID=A0AAD9G6V8_BABDI|nr:hypothetical protein X943_001226 [Babesia divergens]
MMERQTDHFKRKYNIGQTIHPEKQAELQIKAECTPDDLYASDLDDADAIFVKETFGDWPFTNWYTRIYRGVFRRYSLLSGVFYTVNISVDLASSRGGSLVADVAYENTISVKRSLHSETTVDGCHVARCDECQNVVAFLDGDGTYHFRRVIASPP